MPSYTAPVVDTLFILNEIVGIDRMANTPGFAAASGDIVAAILEEGGKFAREVLHPLNAVGDQIGCKRNEDGTVTVGTSRDDTDIVGVLNSGNDTGGENELFPGLANVDDVNA